MDQFTETMRQSAPVGAVIFKKYFLHATGTIRRHFVARKESVSERIGYGALLCHRIGWISLSMSQFKRIGIAKSRIGLNGSEGSQKVYRPEGYDAQTGRNEVERT